jgi:hypothetical protein
VACAMGITVLLLTENCRLLTILDAFLFSGWILFSYILIGGNYWYRVPRQYKKHVFIPIFNHSIKQKLKSIQTLRPNIKITWYIMNTDRFLFEFDYFYFCLKLYQFQYRSYLFHLLPRCIAENAFYKRSFCYIVNLYYLQNLYFKIGPFKLFITRKFILFQN